MADTYCGWCHGFGEPPAHHGRPAVAPTVGLVFGAASTDQPVGDLRVVTSVDAAGGLVVCRPAVTGGGRLPPVGVYFDGGVLPSPDVYRAAARSFGLDADAIAAGCADRDVRALRRGGIAVTVLHGRHAATPALTVGPVDVCA